MTFSLGLVKRLWISVVLETSLQQFTNWRTDKNFKSFMARVKLHKITLHSIRAKSSIFLYMAWHLILYKDAVLVQKCVFKIIHINIAIQSDNQVFLVFAHYISSKAGLKFEHQCTIVDHNDFLKKVIPCNHIGTRKKEIRKRNFNCY